MSDQEFKALLLEEADGKVTSKITTLTEDQLPEGDVTVAVHYSDVNYKDGMIVNGLGRLVRDYPHIPGIDFSGVVVDSGNDRYKAGDEVVLTGWRVGEIHWGGMAEKARVNGDWLVPLPKGLSLEQTMAVGTAGFTSMLCVLALEDAGVTPDKGPVLVTGASGGVGSVAVAILAKLGFEVAAVTGSAASHDFLKSLGATQVVTRDEMSEPAKPLERETWAGVVDTVAGPVLAKALSQLKYGGAVAACGLASGPKLETTVIPFLLRGAKLIGIDSVMVPYEDRVRAWERIVTDLPHDHLKEITHLHSLEEVPGLAKDILDGAVQGRAVIDLRM